MPDLLQHAPHLAVAALVQNKLDNTCVRVRAGPEQACTGGGGSRAVVQLEPAR